ncbi:BnaA02g18120D [Brassica napus]|uniref:(rape) hypothetical protein n=1 Tax=Brassica napus TaxID=3708 RepID=A0A078G4W2_BRANA|nr:unnamed protein product [Brassica napus]CDY20409.1 BnaC02g24070D [Brassica napus]CDY45984.1 BnaA02g18120D [Brassica napus]
MIRILLHRIFLTKPWRSLKNFIFWNWNGPTVYTMSQDNFQMKNMLIRDPRSRR